MTTRKIAAHRALCPHGSIRWPLVELGIRNEELGITRSVILSDSEGSQIVASQMLSIRECSGAAEIDAMAGVEFYEGEIVITDINH